MSAKHIIYDVDARTQIGKGLASLADAVKVTLGPRGRNVGLERGAGAPLITKDGATVAAEIELDDHFSNMGVQMVKQVAATTAKSTGDGTTTAIVLTRGIFDEGAKFVAAGVDPMELKRGIDAAVLAVTMALQKNSKPIRGRAEMEQVATISANGDQAVGRLVAEAVEKVGREGVVTIEEADSVETTLEFTQGMQIDRGYMSSYFVTDEARMEAVFSDAFVLLVEKKISNMQDLVPLLEEVFELSRPLLIIASELEGEALATLVLNKLRGTLAVCAVKAPSFGNRRREVMSDIAVLCGTRSVSDDLGQDLRKLRTSDLGTARKVTVDKDTATLVEGGGTLEAVAARTKELRAQLEDTESEFDREKLTQRIGKLAGGVAVIHVGAATETELKEKKARVEDALHATRAAVAEGIVPGGGVALLRTLPVLDALDLKGEQRYDLHVIQQALEQPLRQIAQNAGLEGPVVVSKVRAGSDSFGYNAATELYEDLVASGVIDPTMVVRVALQNAASVASLMLASEVMIAAR